MKISDLLPIEGLELDPKHTHLEGFTDAYQIRLITKDGLIWIDLDSAAEGNIAPTKGSWCSGHTFYKGKNGIRSFDRRGVDDSFYVRDWDGKLMSVEELRATLVDQVEKARRCIQRDSESVVVPGLPGGFTLTPAELANRRHQLEKTGYIRFAPAGFGTGYTITKKKSRWNSPAKKELVEFLGMGQLYVETFDHD